MNTQANILSIRKSKSGSKLIIEFAGLIDKGEQKEENLLYMLNKSDERFKAPEGKARHSWMSAQKDMALELIPDLAKAIEALDLPENEGKKIALNIPAVIGGKTVKMQVTETTTPDEYQAANLKDTCKQVPDGDEVKYFTFEGKLIFSNVAPVTHEPRHTFIKGNVVSSGEVEAFSNTATISNSVDYTV